MSGTLLASHKQLIEDMRQLIAELEYLKAAFTLLGRDTQVKALEGAIEGTRGMLSKVEMSPYPMSASRTDRAGRRRASGRGTARSRTWAGPERA